VFCLTLAAAQNQQPAGKPIGSVSTHGDIIVLTLDEGALGRANLFDLEKHTLRFTPVSGGYRVENAAFTWDPAFGDELPVSQPGTREFFLTERYCLYAESDGDIYRARIFHQPWPLRQATLKSLATNIFEVNRLPVPKTEPIVHYAEEVNVDIWYLESVEDN